MFLLSLDDGKTKQQRKRAHSTQHFRSWCPQADFPLELPPRESGAEARCKLWPVWLKRPHGFPRVSPHHLLRIHKPTPCSSSCWQRHTLAQSPASGSQVPFSVTWVYYNNRLMVEPLSLEKAAPVFPFSRRCLIGLRPGREMKART